MSWFVYVLVSRATARTYVGIALDLERRLAQHNGEVRGGARSTRAGRPWVLGASFGPYGSRGEAQSVEARLKRERGASRLAWSDLGPAEKSATSPVRPPESSPPRRHTRGGPA